MFRALVHSLPSRKLAFLIAFAAVSGCTLNTDVSGPAAVVKVSGDLQSAAVNTTLPTPLAVIVITQFGDRLSNIPVSWTIKTGVGTLSANSSLTDDTGVASVNFTTGATAGLVLVEAKVQGIPALTFSISVN
jgi:hypothetical protein